MNPYVIGRLPAGLAFAGSLPQDEDLGGSGPGKVPKPAPQNQPGQATVGKDGSGGGGQPAKQQANPCGTEMMLIMLAMVAFFYFFLIRPQQKQEKKRKALLSSLKKNDKVVTNAGIFGTVVALDEKTVTLSVDDKSGVRIKFDRNAVGNILGRPDEAEG